MVSVAIVKSPVMAAPSLKRKRSGSNSADDAVLSSQTKRHKVSFDTSINKIHVVQEYSEKSPALVREEVRRAIERHHNGDSAAYDSLKELLTADVQSDDAPSPTLLRKYIQSLTTLANLLSKKSWGLVNAILDIQWIGRDDDFVEAYIRLLGNLTSAQTGYAKPVLKSLVGKFVALRSSHGRLPNHATVKRSVLRERVHQAIQHVLKVIPSATSVLNSVITTSFPYHTEALRSQVDYVSNLLQITRYEPGVQSEILGLIVDRVVKIDAQTQVDIEELEEELEESLMDEVLASLNRHNQEGDQDQDDVSDDESDDEESESSTIGDPALRRLEELKAAVAKVDAILDLVFDYYHPYFAKGFSREAESAFEQLLAIFTRSILPTHSSRHTQFLLFHFGQSGPVLTERFTFDLLQMAFNQNRPALLRESAAAYLASFVARGAQLSRTTVREVVEFLCTELNKLRQLYEVNTRGPDLQRYSVYYALFQALLYIFCFRWRELTTNSEDEDDDDSFNEGQEYGWLPGLKDTFSRNIYADLNPLKVCAPAIVGQFARLAHHLRLMYIYPKLETNKRIRLSRSMTYPITAHSHQGSTLAAKTGDAQFQLDAYFPFDPYHLPRSKRWLEGEYIVWKTIPGLDDGGEDGSDSHRDEVEEDADDYDDGTETEDDD